MPPNPPLLSLTGKVSVPLLPPAKGCVEEEGGLSGSYQNSPSSMAFHFPASPPLPPSASTLPLTAPGCFTRSLQNTVCRSHTARMKSKVAYSFCFLCSSLLYPLSKVRHLEVAPFTRLVMKLKLPPRPCCRANASCR